MTVVAGAATARAPTPLPQPSSNTPPSAAAGAASAPAASASPSGPEAEAEARPPAAARRSNRPAPADPLSDRATSLLIRRTLCPQQLGDKGRDVQAPIEELLPPLTSRNDVDLQLYAFLAIVLREFVQSWYGKITSDETFVAEVVHVIAHCTRALEQRCRKLDLESLLLDEIPDLLDRHISAYRVAHQPVSQPPVEARPREIYHSLCPLPFLSPAPRLDEPATAAAQLENEKVYRQLLVEAVLSILLPTEDLENPCLTAIVGQIFSELIIGNVIANKAAQPWLLLEAICIAARVAGKKASVPEDEAGSDAGLRRKEWTVQGFFVSIIHLGILAFTSIRFLVTTLVMSSSLPPRAAWTDEKGGVRARQTAEARKAGSGSSVAAKVPVLTFKAWSCVGNLIELPLRMPWLSGFLSLLQHGAVLGPGRIAGLNSPIDRLLSHHIQASISPSQLPPLLRTLRGVLFPNNAPGTSQLSPPSSEAELRALRRRAASALWALLPKGAGRVYFGGRLWQHGRDDDDDDDPEEEALVGQVEGLLMILSDEYCNKHLMYGVLELLLVRLMPELSDKGVVELLDERLG